MFSHFSLMESNIGWHYQIPFTQHATMTTLYINLHSDQLIQIFYTSVPLFKRHKHDDTRTHIAVQN